MVIDEIRQIKSSPPELRRFALIMAVALAAVGGLLMWRRGGCCCWWLFGVSAAFLILGLLAPAVLGPVHKSWMTLAVIMGWFMTRLIQITLFYLVLTPTALLMRLLGKDVLDISLTKGSRDSYWIARGTHPKDRSDYEKQF